MRYLVTGADGFIGSRITSELLTRGHEVVATSADRTRIESLSWFGQVEYHELDLSSPEALLPSSFFSVERVIHLAWSDIPKYLEMVHIEKNLFWSYSFLRSLVLGGVADITVMGTCLEYGMANGELEEGAPTNPSIPYAVAKDALRRFLQQLSASKLFCLKWIRLFYVYGPGQRADSLFGALDEAIARGDDAFDMSSGEQLRDYLHIDRAAKAIVLASEQQRVAGAMNCGSGKPISVRRLVEEYLEARSAHLRLRFGRKTYPAYEPFAFWASIKRLREAIGDQW